MKATKIIALFLSLFTIISVLASCNIIDKGDGRENLQTEKYTANVQIKFATNDDKMKSAIDAMNSSAVVCVDKENINVHTVSASDDTEVVNDYTYIGGILYRYSSVKVGDYTVSDYRKALMDDLVCDELIEKVGAGASIDTDDFVNKTEDESGELTVYSCTDITDEAKASLTSIMSDRFASLGATVYLESADYQKETCGGRTESSVLSCNYVITMGGESYEVTMRLYTSYDYDTPVEIDRPENSESYPVVSSEDIIG